HRVELAAEPTRERTGSAACELLGRVGDFAALLCNGFELTSGVRRGELHDLGHRLRLNHVLRVLEDRIDIGLGRRENFQLILPEAFRGFERAFLETVGSFPRGLARPRRGLACGIARFSFGRFALVHVVPPCSWPSADFAPRIPRIENARTAAWFWKRPFDGTWGPRRVSVPIRQW